MSSHPSKEQVRSALWETRNYKKAAKRLGIPKTTFHDRYLGKDVYGLADEYYELIGQTSRSKRKGGTQGDEILPKSSYELVDGYYRFYAPSLYPSPYLVDKATWEHICFRYSSEGDNATKGQIAMEYDIPRAILEKLLRIYGMYKADPPFTHEAMKAAGESEIEGMLNETVERKKHSFLVQLQRREKESLVREVMQLRSQVYDREKTLIQLQAAAEELNIPSAPPRDRLAGTPSQAMDREYNVLAPIADLHSGKHAWGQESYGGDYDLGIACKRIRWHGEQVVDFIETLPGTVDNLHLADVGDTFHALVGHTEGMTFLSQDSRAYKVWSDTFEAFVARTEALRPHTKQIHLRFAPGNHDWVMLQFFYFALEKYYRSAEDVVVHVGPRWQSYFVEGRTAHIFDHGKGMPENLNANAAKLAADRVARDVMGEDYYRTQYQNFYVGHLHSLSMAMEGKHQQLVRLMPLTAGDDYEAKGRYSGPAGATIYSLREDGRLDFTRDLYC